MHLFSSLFQILALASCEESEAAALLQCLVQASSKFREPSEVAEVSEDLAAAAASAPASAPAPATLPASVDDLSGLLGNFTPFATPRRQTSVDRHQH
jgi:hypothetical protein